MNLEQVQGALEALLFVSGEPLPAERMARVLGVPEAVVRDALQRLAAACRAPGRGLELVEVAGGWQLVTRPEYARAVEELLRPRRQALSRAALETLAIIAYRQPVTRAEIEAIRGVQSEAGLRTLLERGLIREVGRKEAPGRPILYGTTPLFLQQFGLRDLSELPPPEQFRLDAAEPGEASDAGGAGPAPAGGTASETVEKGAADAAGATGQGAARSEPDAAGTPADTGSSQPPGDPSAGR